MILWWTPSDPSEAPRYVTVHEVVMVRGVPVKLIVKEYGRPLAGLAIAYMQELRKVTDVVVE